MSLDRKLLDNFLPEGFETQNLDGYKENFDADRIRTGFDKDTLEILSGPNLNNFLDKTGKNFNILQEVMQFLKDMPIGCFPFINASNQLDYKNISSFFRNVGEIVYSSVPLDDDNLHLADGSIIEGNGKYRRFVKYMIDLMNDYPSLFVTNEVYNTTVNKYGVCGKYVYNAQANTLRLPTYTGIMEATLDSSSLGNVVEAGLPNITGYLNANTNDGTHWGGAFYYQQAMSGADGSNGGGILGFDASRSNPVYGRLQPGAKNQVQPQTVKVYPYVVLSIDESQKQQLTAVYVYQGSVPTKEDLPKEGNVLGHVYNVEYDGFMYGQNYAWNGEDWDPLGGIVDLSKYFTKIEVSNQFATKLSLESNVEFLQGQISQNRADINTLDAGGVISKTPSKLKAATLLATVMDKPQSDIEIFNILMDKKRSTFDKSKFTVVGSPTITDDGVASGFSRNNYIKVLNSVITPLETSTNWQIEIEGTLPPQSTGRVNILGDTTELTDGTLRLNIYLGRVNGSSNFGLIVATNDDGTVTKHSSVSNFSGLDNKKYKCTISFNGVKYLAHFVFENGTIKDIEIDDSYLLDTRDYPLVLGYNLSSYNYSIDLKQFSIIVDGKEVFSGNKIGIDTIKPDNYEVVGSPVISDDGVASGFSDTNYIFNRFQKIITKDLLLKLKFNITNNTSQTVFSFDDTRTTSNSTNCYLLKEGNNLIFDIYVNSTWTRLFSIKNALSDTTSYSIEIHLLTEKKSELVIYKNGIFVNKYIATNTLSQLEFSYLYFGRHDSQSAFTGSIDLNAFKIYVDGNLVYQPTLRIPYTQSKTDEKIVDAVYRDRVQDMYEQFGYTHYYTIGDEPTIPNAYTLPTVSNETIVDMYESEDGTWEQRADLTLRQRGISCTSGTPVTLLKEFRDDKYSLSIGYSSKSASSFTPSASGDWFAEGKVYLQ